MATKLGGGVVVACAACCALSVVPALLVGMSILALGGAALTWGAASIAVAIPVAAAIYLSIRHKPAAPSGGCGCVPTAQQDGTAIACTLGANDFKARTDEIRHLARRSLRYASREPQALRLVYEPEARHEVRALVAKEQQCCSFLNFSVREDTGSIELTIYAPASATEAADALFDHFAPELAASKTKEIA